MAFQIYLRQKKVPAELVPILYWERHIIASYVSAGLKSSPPGCFGGIFAAKQGKNSDKTKVIHRHFALADRNEKRTK